MEELFITLAGDDVAAKSPGVYQMRHYQFRTHESLQRVEELICKIGKSFRAAPHAGT